MHSFKSYEVTKIIKPEQMINVPSAWKGLECIIEDILERFEVPRNECIEFGVEIGFSSVVFSNFFKSVTGVDTFIGDEHTNHKGDYFKKQRMRSKNLKK
ncbi:MAG: hypothetical protein ABIP68_06985 [Ferruginibacter sp.]